MLRELNRFCARFWKDESGVALALTVVILLTMVVLGLSVFAVGETIRQRIELQNAADAAAYSAAVVEADALSRLAAVNRAMGWTYAQEVKMHMDYVVSKWLFKVIIRQKIDYIIAKKIASLSDAICSAPCVGKNDYYAGNGCSQNNHVQLNTRVWVDADFLLSQWKASAAQKKCFLTLIAPLIKAKLNIKGMNASEKLIIKELPFRIRAAATKVLRSNIQNTPNDILSPYHHADIRYALIEETKKCFEVCKSEGQFLRMVFGRGTKAKNLFGTGTDDWYVLKGSGIQRDYKQGGSRLVANWRTRARVWKYIELACVPVFQWGEKQREIKAEESRDGLYTTSLCEPQILLKEYFGKSGTITIGLARRAINPFQFMFPTKVPDGIYRLFSVSQPPPASGRYLWAVATARAGYRDLGRPDGSYNPTVDSWENERDLSLAPNELPDWWRRNHGWQGLSPYNLSQGDWDAVLLPLHRAWVARTPAWENRGPASGAGGPPSPGNWEGESAGSILGELWSSAEWRPLYMGQKGNGLRTWGDGSGPVGMTGGISYQGVDDKVFH